MHKQGRSLVKRATVNYWVDMVTGLAGVVSAISGLVFLWPGEPATAILGISYQVWNVVHTWSSLALIAGIGAHLALHWTWLVATTKRMLSPTSRQVVAGAGSDSGYPEAKSTAMSRRAFLVLGGVAAVATSLVVAGYKAFFDSETAQAGQYRTQPVGIDQEGSVACPFGLVDDPYPGRCRRYRDSNGDGLCDYSVSGSGNNLSTSNEGGWSRRRQGWGQP
jgi:hypothetical protein